ncbi:Lon protease family protein [Candidatus Leptofilum sp.]|uniref:Lon protease family protein n=1 Tax=Candidatus Leptofilum sp. TaxID=3241576 RepID=UPI003B5B45B5
MTVPQPLTTPQLYRQCDPAQFAFATTAELENVNDIIGQTRAVEAIRFGIGIQHNGYNLYALGPNGVGKHTAVNQYLTQRAPTESTPNDWCYVNNFTQLHRPNALHLPAGQGVQFRHDMERLVEDLLTVIPAALNSEDNMAQKKAILKKLKEQESHSFKQFEEQALATNIKIVNTPSGFGFAPLHDGEVISPEKFGQLSPDEQAEIEKRINELQATLQAIIQQVPQWHRETQKKLKKLQEETAAATIKPLFDELAQKHAALPDVLAYLEAVAQDVITNVTEFIERDEPSPSTPPGIASSGTPPKGIVTRYQVNVLVDNSQTNGAPVIFEDQPSYQNLVGRVEHISQMGTLLTDFTLIKAGALHRANGGYLILDARKVLMQPFAWQGLKRALRGQKIHMESVGQLFSYISTVSLEPEPIPLNTKVILTGDRELYYLLCTYDPDFGELFKVAADFENEMPRDGENSQAYAALIASLARKEKLRHFDKQAVARIIEQSSRLAGDATKLTTHMQSISDLLREANYWAGETQHEFVTPTDVQKALDAQVYRSSRIRERIQENILRDTILIDTSGTAVGQVNGLSVIMLDNFAFGRPNRITARVRLGKGEVVDIERQVELGGPIHSKGVMILAGFLGARYAAERPLSLSATLVFEQSYGGVEGDSASSAELYALLSELAGVPVKQSLAVTGSVNQRGQVQVIGGVNEKIEGFFDICQARGFTGEQGVLIPAANVPHLMLHQDVVAAAQAGKFHIYPISHIDEGLALLTGMPTGERDEAGNYPTGSLNARIIDRITELAEKARTFAAPASSNGKSKAAAVTENHVA